MSGWLKHGLMAGLAAGFLFVGTAYVPPADAAGDVIKQRRALMKSNSKASKVFKAFVKKGKGSAADVAKAANQLVSNAGRIPGLFTKGTSLRDAPGKTRAKPAIWVKRSDFEAAAAKLKSAGGKLATVAASGDTAAIKVAAGAMGKACGSCHKQFRGPKPKKK